MFSRYAMISLFFLAGTIAGSHAFAQSVETRLLPSPRVTLSQGDDWIINTRGRFELDAVKVDSEAPHRGGIYDRRTRFGFDATYGAHWGARIEVDFASHEEGDFTDVELAYSDESTLLQLGHFKENFGMERVNSSATTFFNERAAIDTFNPQRGLGAQLTKFDERGSLSLGAFTDSIVSNSKKDRLGITGRGTYSFAFAPEHLLHLGLAGSYRDMDQVSFSSGPDTDSTGIDIVQTGRITDSQTMLQTGLEAAYAWESLLVESEYSYVHLERTQNPTAEFDGWYVQAAWLLTGEQRAYSPANGAVFDVVTPHSPFSLQKGTWGAWEVAARYQEFDLNADGIQGGRFNGVTGGINWYLNNAWRVTANSSYLETDGNSPTPDDEILVHSLRIRVAF